MATANKIPVNNKLPKAISWDGRTVKQIWINVPYYNHPSADKEKNLLYKNDEQFIFTANISDLSIASLAANTLIFEGFSPITFKGNYLTISKDEAFPISPKGQMVVQTTDGEK